MVLINKCPIFDSIDGNVITLLHKFLKHPNDRIVDIVLIILGNTIAERLCFRDLSLATNMFEDVIGLSRQIEKPYILNCLFLLHNLIKGKTPMDKQKVSACIYNL